MRLLLTGANGFIGRYLLTACRGAGHDVVAAVRDPAALRRIWPELETMAIDLNRDTDIATWLPRLQGIDAVVNCAGILQGSRSQSATAIHRDGPAALFNACAARGIRRVVQISAISADPEAGTEYAESKASGDTALRLHEDLDWVILRPSLVYADGAYGGTALMRGLAALPLFLPVPGRGDQAFQPIHIDDLAAALLTILETPAIRHRVIDPVGPDVVPLRTLLADLRQWLGLVPARPFHVPLPLVRLAGVIGDRIGGTINGTAIRQMLHGNTGDAIVFTATTGVVPRGWHAGLAAMPAQVQDRWHARLYFLRPALRWTLALMWMVSGLLGLAQAQTLAPAMLAPALGQSGAVAAGVAASLLDLLFAALLLRRWRPYPLAGLQIATILGYSLVLTVLAPLLWWDAFGPLLKNIPILVAVAMLAALEEER